MNQDERANVFCLERQQWLVISLIKMKKKLSFDNTMKFGLICENEVPEQFSPDYFEMEFLDEFLACKDLKFGKRS